MTAPFCIRFLPWIKLCSGLVLIWLFVFVAAPRVQKYSYIAKVHDVIRENNIDATALVYTEIQEFGDADVHIRDAMNY